MTTPKGAVAAGHAETAAAAAEVLRDGGNAFDAALAALAAACVTEPVLCSLGGGGFLLALTSDGDSRVYDFFCQTPVAELDADALDFRPVDVDFGTTTQEFHTGLGTVATPGVVAGMFAVHDDLGRLPMSAILAPAAHLARTGVPLVPLQADILRAVAPIFLASRSARSVYQNPQADDEVMPAGTLLRMPGLADLLEELAREGPDVFYAGPVAQAIVKLIRDGGSLSADDLARFEVIRRRPLVCEFDGAQVLTNPAPSSGGPLIAFALALLKAETACNGADRLVELARAMALTNQARRDAGLAEDCTVAKAKRLLSDAFLATYRAEMEGRALKVGGTTHISVVDADGNAAALSVSNGEGCGHLLPGTDVMLNNMLGEEDINPQGFFNWRPDSRISSMMAPTLIDNRRGRRVALGSGGSNRIRSAVLQVIVNVLRRGLPLAAAIAAPRIHYERGLLNVEAGQDERALAALAGRFPEEKHWPDRNFFFGGVHAASFDPADGTFDGAGDPRRGGSAVVVR